MVDSNPGQAQKRASWGAVEGWEYGRNNEKADVLTGADKRRRPFRGVIRASMIIEVFEGMIIEVFEGGGGRGNIESAGETPDPLFRLRRAKPPAARPKRLCEWTLRARTPGEARRYGVRSWEEDTRCSNPRRSVVLRSAELG